VGRIDHSAVRAWVHTLWPEPVRRDFLNGAPGCRGQATVGDVVRRMVSPRTDVKGLGSAGP
jgi:hypothetical protein